jgi:hypothetical protein
MAPRPDVTENALRLVSRWRVVSGKKKTRATRLVIISPSAPGNSVPPQARWTRFRRSPQPGTRDPAIEKSVTIR